MIDHKALSAASKTAARMIEQGYDDNPPRCGTCIYLNVTTIRKNRRPNETFHTCQLGTFLVKPRGVCDKWRNSNGETLT